MQELAGTGMKSGQLKYKELLRGDEKELLLGDELMKKREMLDNVEVVRLPGNH